MSFSTARITRHSQSSCGQFPWQPNILLVFPTFLAQPRTGNFDFVGKQAGISSKIVRRMREGIEIVRVTCLHTSLFTQGHYNPKNIKRLMGETWQ